MKRTLLLIAILLMTALPVLAQTTEQDKNQQANQSSAKTAATDSTIDVTPKWPHILYGFRGGINQTDMVYSHAPISRYTHFWQRQGIAGIFTHFRLGKSHISLRPEISITSRADSLNWLDVGYRFQAYYLDLRLPITVNLGPERWRLSPYLMAVPQVNIPYDGVVGYTADDFPNYITAPVTAADIYPYDASVMFGGGFDWLTHVGARPIILSLEAGYNIGLLNTFADREIKDNPAVADDNRSIIRNHFLGAELWEGTRKTRGIEVALRLALPIDGTRWPKKQMPVQVITDTLPPDTVFVLVGDTTPHKPDTVIITHTDTIETGGNMHYRVKDCYSLSEMFAFITLGVDIGDKRICLFNINFDFDSYVLRPESKQPLSEVGMMMNAYPKMRIRIYGHTDSIGSDEYNDRLSLMRARAVLNYLKAMGIEQNRIEVMGYGRRYPIDTNETEEGRFRNRRVEIDILNIGVRITDGEKEE